MATDVGGIVCIVMPEQDAVVTITADKPDMQAELNVVWDRLLPAFHKQAWRRPLQAPRA